MITDHPVHLPAFDYLGPHRYSIRFTTDRRRVVFVSAESVDLVLQQFLRAASTHHFAVITYCFMPDHVHLLVAGESDDADGRAFIGKAKQLSGYHYKRVFGHNLWQRYGFERVLRSDEDTVVVARYILENPVRAGLVARVEDYPFLGSTVYSLRDLLDSVRSGDRPRSSVRRRPDSTSASVRTSG